MLRACGLLHVCITGLENSLNVFQFNFDPASAIGGNRAGGVEESGSDTGRSWPARANSIRSCGDQRIAAEACA